MTGSADETSTSAPAGTGIRSTGNPSTTWPTAEWVLSVPGSSVSVGFGDAVTGAVADAGPTPGALVEQAAAHSSVATRAAVAAARARRCGPAGHRVRLAGRGVSVVCTAEQPDVTTPPAGAQVAPQIGPARPVVPSTRWGGDMEITTVRMSEARELLALVPHRLGFRPRHSAVAVSLRGPRGRVGLVVRVDLAHLADSQHGPALARRLLAYLGRDDAEQGVLVLYTDRDPRGGARSGAPGRGPLPGRGRTVARRVPVWVVADSGYLSLDCVDDCCPPGGRPLVDLDSTQVGAHLVLAGSAVADSREDIARIRSAGAERRRTVARARRRWESRRAEASVAGPDAVAAWRLDSVVAWREVVRRVSGAGRTRTARAVGAARGRSGGPPGPRRRPRRAGARHGRPCRAFRRARSGRGRRRARRRDGQDHRSGACGDSAGASHEGARDRSRGCGRPWSQRGAGARAHASRAAGVVAWGRRAGGRAPRRCARARSPTTAWPRSWGTRSVRACPPAGYGGRTDLRRRGPPAPVMRSWCRPGSGTVTNGPSRRRRERPMGIVVGYLATPEGRAALDAAIDEARRRQTPVVVVVSARPGEPEADRAAVEADLDAGPGSARRGRPRARGPAPRERRRRGRPDRDRRAGGCPAHRARVCAGAARWAS